MVFFNDAYKSEIIEKVINKKNDKSRINYINKISNIKSKNRKNQEKRKVLHYDKNGKWNKEKILEVLKEISEEYGKLTCPLLDKLRKEDPEKYPAPSTVLLRFDTSWKEICKQVGGRAFPIYYNSMSDTIEVDVYYYLELYHKFGLKTAKLYKEARRKYPEVVPSYRSLIRMFGSFLGYRKIAKMDSCSEQIKKLVDLIENLNGRWPKRKQCKEKGIDIVFLDKRFGGRRELRSFVADIRSNLKR